MRHDFSVFEWTASGGVGRSSRRECGKSSRNARGLGARAGSQPNCNVHFDLLPELNRPETLSNWAKPGGNGSTTRSAKPPAPSGGSPNLR